MSQKVDIEEVKVGLQQQLPAVIERLYGNNARWLGNGWRLGNTEGEKGNSLAIEGRDQAKLGLWHDHATDESGDILDLIAAAEGTDFKGALAWACDFLGLKHNQPLEPKRSAVVKPVISSLPQTQQGKVLEVAHPRSLEAARRRLLDCDEAIAYLHGRGLQDETIKHFFLGLESYEGKNSFYKDAISFPLLDADGEARKRWFRLRVPGLTKGGPNGDESAKDWATGSPATYWATPSRNRTLLFVCEGAKDSWWLWQTLQNTSSPLAGELCVITSTHGSGIPEEWKQADFWQAWDAVFVGQDADDAGDHMAEKVRDLAHRDVMRVRVPEGQGKDWTDYFKAGHTIEEFQALLLDAPVLDFEIQLQGEPLLPQQAGLHAATPVDISSAYVNGHLYVPFRVLDRQIEREKTADGTTKEVILQRYRTLVLRSDGVVCNFDYLPAPRGTPREDMVMALSDGTIIERAPVVDEARSTFSLNGITRLREASKEGRSALTMSPEQLLSSIEQHLRSATILPYSEDYALLTYVALTTYAQQIFDAVPLVLVVGAAGSGKTDLGRSMVNVSCNASIITGQTSAATAARVLDQLNGLAVFDDLEEIGSRSNGGEFSEFVQQLKVSYKKDTSTKSWTNTKTMKVERLNFYGVKLITNTQGAEGILSTRMLRVYTKKLSKELLEAMPEQHPLTALELQELRDNLHIWVMENVHRIDEHYRTHYGKHGNRQEEITAPLLVLADLIPHPKLSSQLKLALERQTQGTRAEMSSIDLLHEAMKNLIREGHHKQVAMKNLLLEMKNLVGPDWGRQNKGEISEWQEPRWVGKMLRSEQIVDPHIKDKRSRLPIGQTTVLGLEESYTARILGELREEKQELLPLADSPIAFCNPKTCVGCSYYDVCDMRPEKQVKYGDTEWKGE